MVSYPFDQGRLVDIAIKFSRVQYERSVICCWNLYGREVFPPFMISRLTLVNKEAVRMCPACRHPFSTRPTHPHVIRHDTFSFPRSIIPLLLTVQVALHSFISGCDLNDTSLLDLDEFEREGKFSEMDVRQSHIYSSLFLTPVPVRVTHPHADKECNEVLDKEDGVKPGVVQRLARNETGRHISTALPEWGGDRISDQA
jgi:hypothetical protein